ncbi:MAG: hypothetical protein ACE5L7_03245, partial [Candidatus Aminicenantales bacterium]
EGTILESTAKEGEWYRIQIVTEEKESVSGYVHESLVIVISPPPEKKEEIKVKEKEEEPTEIKVFPVPSLPSPEEHRLDLLLSGGLDFINGGDLNSGAQGLAHFLRDSLALEGEARVHPLRLSYIFGGELNFPLSPTFGLGVGVDYFFGSRESRVEFRLNDSIQNYITRPKITAVPLRIFLSFHPFSVSYIKTGVEYYFAQCVYLYRVENGELWEEWKGEAKAHDFGFFGGFGVEWKIYPPLSLVVEATWRYARITGFEGKNTYRDSEGSFAKEEGKLYFYQGIGPGEKAYPLLFIRRNKPSGNDVSDPKEAIVDFSGLSLKVGIKIRF